uniref:SJCHGC03336 protein n=1 Tax=Schistosoma japonicum TaxID=6182 RepID=Q5DFS4_SCHJA|nr:SJCHGC03336 protein [Schistosoma japonicum]
MDIHSDESHKKLKEQMIVDPFLRSFCDPRKRSEPYWVTLPLQPLDTLKLNELPYQPYCSFCFKDIPRNRDIFLSHSNSHESYGSRFIKKSCDDICCTCSEELVNGNILNGTFTPDNCPQQNMNIHSNISCNKTLCDFISIDESECHNRATANNLNTAKPYIAFINNPHTTLSFTEQHVCKPLTDAAGRSDTNAISQDIRHCKRLPSNWSTISRTLTSNCDASVLGWLPENSTKPPDPLKELKTFHPITDR